MRVTRVDNQSGVSPYDRGLLYGDGFFTTCLVYQSQIVFWSDHVARLEQSAKRLEFDDIDVSVIERDIGQLPDAGIVKIIISRGAGERGYAAPPEANYQCYIYVADYRFEHQSPISLTLSSMPISRNQRLAGLKHLNRLDNVLAKTALSMGQDAEFDDALMCDSDHIICSTQANVFAVKGDKVLTPLIDYAGVEGVMKKNILRWANSVNWDVEHTNLTANDILNADEVFLSNCVKGIIPVLRLDDTEFYQFDYAQQLQCMFDQQVLTGQ